MARIAGVEANEAGLLTRVAYWFTRRKIGRVVLPIKIHAHSTRLLRGMAFMEMAQEKHDAADPALIALVEVKVATLIGCPF